MSTQFLIDFIRSSGGVTNEFLLLQFVENTYSQFFEELGQNPSLFKKHFYLYHELYKLREDMEGSEQSLVITSVEIKLCVKNDLSGKDLAEPDALQGFYLNSENLNLTDEQVSKMLANFWQKYIAVEKKSQAIQLLGLENRQNLDLPMIKNRFKQLAHKHHPDKGGKQEYFQELKQAFDTLKCLF